MPLKFHYAAHGYADTWVTYDRKAREVLGFERATSPTVEGACKELKKVANDYRIARNFRKEIDGCERFSPVWKALVEIKKRPDSEEDAKNYVNQMVESLKPTYKRVLLSAASKFLWMRFGSPIIIYDSLTAKWMCRNGNCPNNWLYNDFYDAWRKKFNENQKEIVAACDALLKANITTFLCPSECPSEEEKNEFEQAVKSLWFAERVFDLAIMIDQSQGRS